MRHIEKKCFASFSLTVDIYSGLYWVHRVSVAMLNSLGPGGGVNRGGYGLRCKYTIIGLGVTSILQVFFNLNCILSCGELFTRLLKGLTTRKVHQTQQSALPHDRFYLNGKYF
jgi:hypothetical protein